MADNRKAYEVTIGGLPHTLLLDEDGAKSYGENAKPVQAKAAPKLANKARTADNK